MRQSINFLICMSIRMTIRKCSMLVPLLQAKAKLPSHDWLSPHHPLFTRPHAQPLHLPGMGSYHLSLR